MAVATRSNRRKNKK
jgi:hypothetical protein